MKLPIYFTVNIAKRKPAWHYPDVSNTNYYQTDRLTDGETDTIIPASQCAHTVSGADPWLMVDLLRMYFIWSVKTLNRGDCCGEL